MEMWRNFPGKVAREDKTNYGFGDNEGVGGPILVVKVLKFIFVRGGGY